MLPFGTDLFFLFKRYLVFRKTDLFQKVFGIQETTMEVTKLLAHINMTELFQVILGLLN